MALKFELNENAVLTEKEREQLEKAKNLPVVYDEDSPELTDDMEKAFTAARKAKPYRREPLTLYVSSDTIDKVKCMGSDYISILGKLLDKAVADYKTV